MSQVKTENPLGYAKISSLLRKFAIPSIIAMLVSSLYNVVDQIFIGQGVGYLGNAATNVSFPLVTICMALTLSIGIGSGSRFSLYLGQKQEEKAARVVGNGFCLMVSVGIIYAFLVEIFLHPLLTAFGATPDVMPYALVYTRITAIGFPFLMIMNGMSNLARADGSPFYSMMSMVIGAVINTILDPVFIFIFNMGVAGAAWATIIGQAASLISSLLYFKKFQRVTLKKEYFHLNIRQAGRTMTMGLSQGLNQVALTLVQIVMNWSMVYYGGLSKYGSDIPLATNGIIMKVNAIVLAVVIGINQGMQPIIGFNYGAKLYPRVKATYRLAIFWELLVTLIATFIFQVFPDYVLALFGKENALYMEFAVRFMRTFLIMLPLNGIQMISSNFFSAIGKPIKGALLALTRAVFFFIPTVLILPLFLQLQGILIAAPISDFTAFALVIFFIIKEFKSMK
ncbi:MAG: MATE family efflux transporter [Treponema sp.]|nr:MATE family efflux transporter [Treponema sp.]